MFKKTFKFISLVTAIAFVFSPIPSFSLPEGEQVVAGSASFDRSVPDTLNINQSTDKLIANYDSFSIAQPEAVHFLQPSSSSIALNRVIGGDPSSILGTMTANGRIFLVNPNGVLFGPGAQVSTAGLVASTLNLSNEDFLAGRYTFLGAGGAILNQGYISAPGGYVALLGSTVENSGIIEAELGSIALASGNATTLNLDPKGLISVVVDEATITNLENKEAALKNTGTLKADAGKVILTAKTLEGVFEKAINTEGIIEANAIAENNGEIIFEANQRVDLAGSISARNGKVTVDSQGADISAGITAKEAVFNMNDGDTYLNGASFSGDNNGTYSGTGDFTLLDNGNIDVTGTLTLTDGDFTLIADNNANNSGNLNIHSADISSNGGNIYFKGFGVNIAGSAIESIAPPGEGADDVTIQITSGTSSQSSNYEEDDFSYTQTESEDFLGNDLTINESSISAQALTNAYIEMKAGNIDVEASSITANAPENGNATVFLQAVEEFYSEESETGEELSGEYDYSVTTDRTESSYGGTIDIQGSSISANVEQAEEYKTALVSMQAGDIAVSNSEVTASLNGYGSAEIEMYAGSRDYEYLQENYFLGESSYPAEDYEVWTEILTGGMLEIDNSSVSATVFKPAEIIEDPNLSTGAYVDLEARSITIDPSIVSADFSGNNGDAEVFLFAAEGSQSDNCLDCEESYGGSVDIIDSSVLATATDGEAEIFIETGTKEPGESQSYVNILNSSVIADVNGEGHAGVYIYNEFETMDIFDELSLGSCCFAEDLGSPIIGPINIENSLVHAEASSEADGETAVVYMNTADTLTVINSEISTSEVSGLTAIALLADEINIDSASSLNASAGDGFALVALGANKDISTGTITATGNMDSISELEYLLNGDVGPDTYYLDILNQYNYGSAVLIGSLEGNISGPGMVTADYLAMFARHNIGPVNTDVVTLNAYSWDYGDIYINEANSLEVGLFLPIGLSYFDSELEEIVTEPLLALGASVAANDGIVSIVSGGDMLVNSIIAPNAGVFLQSLSGSIYAGTALDPLLDDPEATAEDISYLAYALLGIELDPEDIAEIGFMGAYTPVQIGVYDSGYESEIPANVIAGGYSYFSTPQGTVGVGTPDLKDPAISGEIAGIVNPGVEAVTGFSPSPGIDLSRTTPPGLVYFTPLLSIDPQIWPEELADPEITSGNPLVVDIEVNNPDDTRALPEWFLNSNPAEIAALSLEIGPPPVLPQQPLTSLLDPTTQLAGPLAKHYRAYYEILGIYRFVSFEPATPTTFYAYHPLISMDESAFDGIFLDIGAYDFINDNIKNKKPLSPYFGVP